jgi:hypothetical protein
MPDSEKMTTWDNETNPQWKTITKYPLRPRVLWELWQDTNQLVGVRFDSAAWYALIDIDSTSPYHPAKDSNGIRQIRAALETIGICRSILIRSSLSGGLHLYIPLPVTLPTFGIATAIEQCLKAQEFDIAPGKLEIFPNRKAYAIPGTTTEYNAHRLPLQPNSGSCLLDDEGNQILGGLEEFFQQWDVAASGQDVEELHAAISIARSNRRRRKRATSIVEDWKQDLQTEMQDGWTGHGQTNHLLKTIACYGVVFQDLKGDALADYVLEYALNAKGYERFCQHQHEIQMRCTVWARSAEGYYWALGSDPKRSGEIHSEAANKVVAIDKNRLRAEDAQQRIKTAIANLEAAGQLPRDATERLRALSEEAKTSSQTLYKYRDLWHPNQPKQPGCEIALVETVLTVLGEPKDSPLKSPETSDRKKFHTLEGNMKCKSLNSSLSKSQETIFKEAQGIEVFSDQTNLNPIADLKNLINIFSSQRSNRLESTEIGTTESAVTEAKKPIDLNPCNDLETSAIQPTVTASPSTKFAPESIEQRCDRFLKLWELPPCRPGIRKAIAACPELQLEIINNELRKIGL